MLKFFLIATLLFCLSAGPVFLACAEDAHEIEMLLPPPDGTDGLLYAVGIGEAKGGDSAAVTRFSKPQEYGDLSITKALGFYGDVHTARTIAIEMARESLAHRLGTRVTLFKTPETRATTSESTTDNMLIGARVIKTVITQQDGGHTVEVLMAMPAEINVAHRSVKKMNKEVGMGRGDAAEEVALRLKAQAWEIEQNLANQSRSETKDLDWQQVADTTAAYPEWFWHPPADLPFPTVVGYSSIASDSDLALEQAINNGIENLTKQTHIDISILIDFSVSDEEPNKEIDRKVTLVFS